MRAPAGAALIRMRTVQQWWWAAARSWSGSSSPDGGWPSPGPRRILWGLWEAWWAPAWHWRCWNSAGKWANEWTRKMNDLSEWCILANHWILMRSYHSGFSCHTIIFTHSQEKLPGLISSFDPEGAVCVSVDVGGLDLEDVRRHVPVRLDAHILVNDWGREALTLGLRSADTATASAESSRWDSFPDRWNAPRCPLTFQRFWCKAPHRGFWDSIGSLRNNSSTFHHLDSYESPSHIHLCLAIAEKRRQREKGFNKIQ